MNMHSVEDSSDGNQYVIEEETQSSDMRSSPSSDIPTRASAAGHEENENIMVARQEVLSIHSALDRIGYGPFQRRILVAAGSCSAADAMEILMLSFLSVQVADDWNLTPSQQSGLISCVFAGAFVGTLLLGRLGDIWGRRPIFLTTAGVVAVGGLCSALCQSYWQLVVCRAIVGMGIGGVTIPFDTYAEILPTSRRGSGLAVPSYFWTMGTLLVVIGARVTAPSWRGLCVWCAVPCLMATGVAYYVVPESPQWLVSQGRSTLALHILREAAARNGLDPNALLPLDTILVLRVHHQHMEEEEEEEVEDGSNAYNVKVGVVPSDSKASSSSVCDLFARDRLCTSVSILAVWFGYALLYYGVVLAITAVFEDGDGKFDYEAILVASLSETVATTLTIFTIDKWGRKRLHALSFGLGGVFVFGLCWLGSSSNGDGTGRRLSILLSFLSRMWIFVGSAVTWIWTAEVLETHLRTTGHSMANAGGRIGGFVSPYLVSPTRFSYPTIGIILWIVSWTLVTIAWCNLPETVGAPMGSGGSSGTSAMEEEESTLAGGGGSVELRLTSSIVHRKRQYQSLNATTELT